MNKSTKGYITIDDSFYNIPKEWNLTDDLIFHYMFARDRKECKMLLADLVNTVLGLKGERRIVGITYKSPFNLAEYKGDKQSVVDIRATADNGMSLNIEMQVRHQIDYVERSLYYWSKLYSDQLEESNPYGILNPTVGIHFLDHRKFKKNNKAHVIHKIYDEEGNIATDIFQMHYIQIPLVGDILKENRELFDWITIMKDIANPAERNTVEKIINKKDVMRLAFKTFKEMTADEQARYKLEQQLKYERDKRAQDEYERQEWKEEGLAEGREEGREQGREQGREEVLSQIITTMHTNGISVEAIAEMTGIDVTIVEEILAKTKK